LVSEQLLGLILSAAIGIVGILATLAGVVLTNRSAQKLLTIQLQHEENKKAIRDLNSLLISTPPATTASVYYDEFRGFLQSIDSAYLPDAIIRSSWTSIWLGPALRIQDSKVNFRMTCPTSRMRLPRI